MEIIHLFSRTPNLSTPFKAIFIGLIDQFIQPKKQVKSLGIVIDYHWTFGSQALTLAATLKNATMSLKNFLWIKGTTIFTAYHFTLQTVIPAGLLGSEISWTGTHQVLNWVQLAYNYLAHVVV